MIKLDNISLATKPNIIQKQPVEEQNDFYKTIKIPSKYINIFYKKIYVYG